MKKLLNLFIIFIICFITCGCTQADLCSNSNERPVFSTPKAQKEYIYNFNMTCYINPSFTKKDYSEDSLQRLTKLVDKFDDNYFDGVFPNSQLIYKDLLSKTITNIFGELKENPQMKYDYFLRNILTYSNDYEWYFKEAEKLLNTQDIYNNINNIYNYFEVNNYFNDYRIVDMFSLRLLGLMIATQNYEYEPLLFKTAIHNNNKPNAQRNAKFFSSLLYMDENYYKKYQ